MDHGGRCAGDGWGCLGGGVVGSDGRLGGGAGEGVGEGREVGFFELCIVVSILDPSFCACSAQLGGEGEDILFVSFHDMIGT